MIALDLQFFAKDGPGGEKTEPATAKRLQDARKDGKVAKSQELTGGVGLLMLFVSLRLFIGRTGSSFLGVFNWIYKIFPDMIRIDNGTIGVRTVSGLLSSLLLRIIIIVIPFFAIGFIVAFVLDILQVGWKITTKPMQPKFDKLNPLNGFKRIFSAQALFNLLKSMIKLVAIAIIVYSSLKNRANDIFILYGISLNQAIALLGDLIISIGLKVAVFYVLVGVADYIYQKWKFGEDMKMTKQEVKDEFKETEGDPTIKGQQRQRMQQASMRRMMSNVPKADVVITNPTHLACALKYESGVDPAPILLAKGADYVAGKIKDKAKEAGVPIKENKPVARAIYASVEVGEAIPPELYVAVAEILATLYQETGKQIAS